MLHFGLDTLAYFVKFDKSCYSILHNISKEEPKFLFGASFGLWNRNSISIYRRSSLHYIDKIDLFAVRYSYWKKSDKEYIGSIDTDMWHTMDMKFEKNNNIFHIAVRSHDHIKKLNFSTHFDYPVTKWGFIKKETFDDIINLERA